MIAIASLIWPWLAASVAIGIGMGWISVVHRGNGMPDEMIARILALLFGLVLISAVQLLPGRVGYWLDLALVMVAAYLAGCLIGTALRGWLVSRHQSNSARLRGKQASRSLS